MDIQIHSKISLTPEQKEYIEKKINALQKINQKILSVKVDVEHDTHHQKGNVFFVKIHINVPGKILIAEERKTTISEAIDVLERELVLQLKKAKEKEKSKKLREAREEI